MAEVCVSFVSRKINKVRWRPFPRGSIENEKHTIFASGSWDDENNLLSLWQCPESSLNNSASDSLQNLDGEPRLLSEVSHSGDVTDLRFLSNDLLVASSSTGNVQVYKCNQKQQGLKLQHSWEKVHQFPNGVAPCTGLATKGDDICSVGEDGKISILNLNKKKPILEIEKADSCSLTAVCYVRQQEVVASNIRGHLKVWDLRAHSSGPSKALLFSGEQVAVFCIGQHPSQPHVLVTGTQNGLLSIWDLRQESQPVTVLDAHSAAIMEVKFHPQNPDLLFTCSQDGSLWQWDASNIKSMSSSGSGKLIGSEIPSRQTVSSGNPWLNCDATKHRLEIVSLLPHSTLPVNSLDIEDSTLICGSDNEALYVVSGLKT